MFGYEGGEAKSTLARMLVERDTARARWPFLTTLDLSMIHNEPQLATMVKDRSGKSRNEAEADVHEWLRGYETRVRPAGSMADTSIGGWTDDGGPALSSLQPVRHA